MMNKKDFEIIKELRNNSRQTLTQISRKTHIPISTLYDKLKVYEKEAIFKHTTLLDFRKFGYNTRAQIYIKTKVENRDKLKKFLLEHSSVNNLYLLTNEFDFSIDCVFEDVKKVRDFMDYLDQNFYVEKQNIIFVAKEIRNEGFLAS